MHTYCHASKSGATNGHAELILHRQGAVFSESFTNRANMHREKVTSGLVRKGNAFKDGRLAHHVAPANRQH